MPCAPGDSLDCAQAPVAAAAPKKHPGTRGRRGRAATPSMARCGRPSNNTNGSLPERDLVSSAALGSPDWTAVASCTDPPMPYSKQGVLGRAVLPTFAVSWLPGTSLAAPFPGPPLDGAPAVTTLPPKDSDPGPRHSTPCLEPCHFHGFPFAAPQVLLACSCSKRATARWEREARPFRLLSTQWW